MKVFVWSLVFVLLMGMRIVAQDANKKTPASPVPKTTKPASNNAEKELSPLQQRALSLLKSLVKETTDFEDQPMKIKAQAKIADTLWSYDQPRAREIFSDAFAEIETIKFPAIKVANDSPVSSKALELLFSNRSKLRQEVLQLIMVRDSDLAEKLRASTEEKKTTEQNDRDAAQAKEIRTVERLNIARSLATTEPLKAAQIVRQTLQEGFNANIISVLMGIRSVNPELSATLFLESLTAARQMQGSLFSSIGSLAFFFMDEKDTMLGRDPFSDPTRAALITPFLQAANEIIARHVAIESEGTPVFENSKATTDYMILQQMLPWFSRFLPDAVPTVRLRINQLAKYLPNEQAKGIEKGISQPTDYESTLKEAESSTDPVRKDGLYMMAATQANMQGKSDEALRFVDKINDRERREMGQSVVRYQIVLKAVNKGELDTALRYAREINFSPQRVIAYKMIAESYLSKKDYQRASEILPEIERWLETSANDPKKALGLLIITAVIASYDVPHGFDAMKVAVNALNNIDFTAPVKKYEEPISIDSLDFALSFAPLARADFERANLIALSILKKEAAVKAQIEICKAVLSDAANRRS